MPIRAGTPAPAEERFVTQASRLDLVEVSTPRFLCIYSLPFPRERSSVKRIVYSVLAASATAAAISGCSASEIVNTGGDTKCKDFLTQDEKKQNDEVSKMLKDKSGQDPANLEITATKASVLIYCQTLGQQDTKISEAPHG